MDEKIIQYVKGNITSGDEIKEILDWIEASEANQKRYNEIKNIWVLSGLQTVDPIDQSKFFRGKTVHLNFVKTVLKYAAVFILAFIAGALSLYLLEQKPSAELANVYNEIQVPNGEKSNITLYDGTKVWLNSGTRFRYPATFSGHKRNVFVEGEAYFEVAKDKANPFIVNSGNMEVTVTGTRFNVYSYPDEDLFSATLEEGSVNVGMKSSEKSYKLNPGEQFKYLKSTNTAHLLKVDTRLYSSWKENILRFENAPLAEILKKMERWYDVKFVIDENLNTSERYTTSIKTESLREMLKVLSLTTEMKYEINENIVKISKP